MEKKRAGRKPGPKSRFMPNKPRSPEFFKVFLPHNLTSQKLLIPPDYVKHFNRSIQERIILKDAKGKYWHVVVERTTDGVFITSGWESFVTHHCLKVGDFLVFKYDGNYLFEVKIFGTNGCNKDAFTEKDIAASVKIEADEPEKIIRKSARLV